MDTFILIMIILSNLILSGGIIFGNEGARTAGELLFIFTSVLVTLHCF